MIKLMQVPGWLIDKVAVGGAYVDGAMVKDALSHQILAHLQPTASLTKWIVGQVSGLNPVGLVSSVVQNVQLMQLQRMVDALRTVASIGAAASVLNLGVSVGGFALVLSSLRRVESQLADQGATIQAVAKDQQAQLLGRARSALGRAEEAFQLSSPAERRRYWREADLHLHEVVEVALQRLADRGVTLEGASPAGALSSDVMRQLGGTEVLDTLRWLLAFAAARAELLLCLHEPAAAARLSSRTANWMQALAVTASELAKSRLTGLVVPPQQMQQVVQEAKATSLLINQSHQVATERSQLCEALELHGVDTEQYVMQVRQDPELRVLALLYEAQE